MTYIQRKEHGMVDKQRTSTSESEMCPNAYLSRLQIKVQSKHRTQLKEIQQTH